MNVFAMVANNNGLLKIHFYEESVKTVRNAPAAIAKHNNPRSPFDNNNNKNNNHDTTFYGPSCNNLVTKMIRYLLLLLALTQCQAVPAKEAVYKPGEIPNQPVRINKENFESMLQDKTNPLWLLKFYAPW
jgi:hypothetical protein